MQEDRRQEGKRLDEQKAIGLTCVGIKMQSFEPVHSSYKDNGKYLNNEQQ
jgi:hypothetical protein